MTRSRLWPTPLTSALLLALTACGGSDGKSSELPTLTPQSTSSASSPPSSVSPTASPTKAVTKYQDLTLELLRSTTLQPKASVAYERLQRLQELFASMIAGSPTPAEFSQLANGTTVKRFNELLKPQRQAKERGGGQLTIRTTKITASTSLVVIEGCFDQTRLVTVRPNGTRYVDPTVKESPTMTMRAVLSNTAGPWRVDEHFLVGGKC
jgi:hypothetical protein